MNKKLLLFSIVVSMAGFLFGFDTVVISGANLPVKELWNTSDWFHGFFIMSMALWGTVIGALLSGIPTDKYGRKTTLIWIGVLFFASAVGSALAPDPYSFSFFRFIGGLGVGASSIAAPTYISEIADAKNRGRLGIFFQMNLVFGVLIAFISNYLLDGVGGENDWRWMLGVEAIPALAYTLLMFTVTKSPRWLIIHQKDIASAIKILKQTMNESEAQKMVNDIQADHSKTSNLGAERLFSSKFRKPLMLAFLLAFFNQMSGINFILYYAPEILEKAGFAASDSLLSSVSLGITNLLFTIVGMYFIDRAGRKQLMYIGSIGYIISLSMVAYGFYADGSALFKLLFILMFIASHAIGQGSVIWIFISEIFPNRVRAYGQAWGCGTHWVFAALITQFGAVLINKIDAWIIFAVFAGCMVLQLLFTHFLMPETKGKSLEELEEELVA